MRASSFLKAASVVMLLALASVPTAASEPLQVEECSRECDPASVNEGRMKTGKEPVNLLLYGHFRNHLDQAPLNTQKPDPNFEVDLNVGFLMPVIDTNSDACVPPQGTCADFHFKHNQFTMFSSPGFVEYLTDGSWYTHQEPGLAADAKLVGDEIRLYWYMSAHAVSGMNSNSGLGATAAVGAMPQVGVYARMETGRFAFRGETIAASADFDENAVGSPERANMVTVPGQPDVYEFQVKMRILKDAIPNSHLANGFIVYVNPYQVKTEAEEGTQFAQPDWRLRTGPRYPPRLVVPVEEPMKTVASSLTIFDQRLFLRWSFVSAMGSYDMKDASLALAVTGTGQVEPKAVDFINLKRSVDHDGHFKPVNATWAIDYVNFPLADGEYELTASIPNMQGTYLLTEKFAFNIVGGKPDVFEIGKRPAAPRTSETSGPIGDSPAPGVILFLVAVAVAGTLLRRP